MIGKAIALLCLSESVAVPFSMVRSRREIEVQGGTVEVDTLQINRRKTNKNVNEERQQNEAATPHPFAIVGVNGYISTSTDSPDQQDDVRVHEWPEVSQAKGNASSALQNRATSANPTSIGLLESSIFEESVSRKYYTGNAFTKQAAEKVCNERFRKKQCTSAPDLSECMSFSKTDEEDKKLMENNGFRSRESGWSKESAVAAAVPNFQITWDVNFDCSFMWKQGKTCQDVCMEEAPKQVSLAIAIRKACAEKQVGGMFGRGGTPVTSFQHVVDNFLQEEWSERSLPSDECVEWSETCCEEGFVQVLQKEADEIKLKRATKIELANLQTEIQEKFREYDPISQKKFLTPIFAALHRSTAEKAQCEGLKSQCEEGLGEEATTYINGEPACTCRVRADTFNTYSESILGTADAIDEINLAKKTFLEVKNALDAGIREQQRKIRLIELIEKEYTTILELYKEAEENLRIESVKLNPSNLDASSCDDLRTKLENDSGDYFDALYTKGTERTGCIGRINQDRFVGWYRKKLHQATKLKDIISPENLLVQMNKFNSLFKAQIESAQREKAEEKAKEGQELYEELLGKFDQLKGCQTMTLTKDYFAHQDGSAQPSKFPPGKENQPCSELRRRCGFELEWDCRGDGCSEGSFSDICTCVVNQAGLMGWKNSRFRYSNVLDHMERAIYSMNEFKRILDDALAGQSSMPSAQSRRPYAQISTGLPKGRKTNSGTWNHRPPHHHGSTVRRPPQSRQSSSRNSALYRSS